MTSIVYTFFRSDKMTTSSCAGIHLDFDLLDAKHFKKDFDPSFCITVALQLAYEVEQFLMAWQRGEANNIWEMITREKIKQCERLFSRLEDCPTSMSAKENHEVTFFHSVVDRAIDRFERCVRESDTLSAFQYD